jgi:hypothetical protein
MPRPSLVAASALAALALIAACYPTFEGTWEGPIRRVVNCDDGSTIDETATRTWTITKDQAPSTGISIHMNHPCDPTAGTIAVRDAELVPKVCSSSNEPNGVLTPSIDGGTLIFAGDTFSGVVSISTKLELFASGTIVCSEAQLLTLTREK